MYDMLNIILGASISASIGLIFGAMMIAGLVQYSREQDSAKDFTPIEKLKNALLTMALVTINKDDMATLDMNYDGYNGSKFPALSGCSLENACFTYIFNEKHFRKSRMYSNQFASKMDAINKYLQINLSTEKQVMEFFSKFCATFKKDNEGKNDSNEPNK
jgi:hypothetical protein